MIQNLSVASVGQDLDNLASLLAMHKDHNGAERLRSLSAGVKGISYADVWAASNVPSIVDPEGIVERFKRQKSSTLWIDILEWVRNALVLAPLLLTWYCISQTLPKYNALIATLEKINTLQTQQQAQLPFLYLWQQQFVVPGVHTDPLPGWLTLSSVAFYDFLLLTIILILTILVFGGASLQNRKREQEAEQLRVDLNDAIANASLCLLARRQTQPTNFTTLVQQLIKQMEDERKRLDELSARREKEFDALGAFTENMAKVSDQMSKATMAIEQTNQGLVQSVNALAGTAKDISDQQKLLMQTAKEAVSQLQDVTYQLRGMNKTIVDELQAVSRTLAAQLQGVSKTVVEQMQGVGAAVVGQMASSNQKLEELVRKQEDWGKSFVEAQKELTTVLDEVGKVAKQMQVFSEGQDEFIKHLDEERQTQTRIANQVSYAMGNIEQFARLLGDYTVTLHGMAIDVFDLKKHFAEIPDNIRKELAASLQGYSVAGTQLWNSANMMHQASQALGRSAYMLEQRLNEVR